MKVIIVIPARYKSSRFPGKPLTPLLGKPMILWVAELSASAVGKRHVYIATDDERIADVIKKNGFNVVMTSESAMTGTDRLSEVAKVIDADIYVNVQGDEPLVNISDINKIIDAKKQFPGRIINGYCKMSKEEDPSNINIPKVIFTEKKDLIYMSRKDLPGYKDSKNKPVNYYKQVCIYAFNRDELIKYGQAESKSYIESLEDIEILRFLEWEQSIHMVECEPGSLAVDVPEDVEGVERELRKRIID